MSVRRTVRINRIDLPRLSPKSHNAEVHEATSSKKGPHRQSSSVLGSQPDIDAASFQQFVYKIVSSGLNNHAGWSHLIIRVKVAVLTVHGPTPATLAPMPWRLINGDRGVTGDAIVTPTIPKTTTSDKEAFIFSFQKPNFSFSHEITLVTIVKAHKPFA
jgi:hypothetical protein